MDKIEKYKKACAIAKEYRELANALTAEYNKRVIKECGNEFVPWVILRNTPMFEIESPSEGAAFRFENNGSIFYDLDIDGETVTEVVRKNGQ